MFGDTQLGRSFGNFPQGAGQGRSDGDRIDNAPGNWKQADWFASAQETHGTHPGASTNNAHTNKAHTNSVHNNAHSSSSNTTGYDQRAYSDRSNAAQGATAGQGPSASESRTTDAWINHIIAPIIR